jgi:hypothetical protein
MSVFFFLLRSLRSTGLISQFLDHSHTIGLLGRVISSSQGLYLNTGQHKRRKTHTHQTTMPWVGFEPAIPAFERVKTVHALDRSATVTGSYECRSPINSITNPNPVSSHTWQYAHVVKYATFSMDTANIRKTHFTFYAARCYANSFATVHTYLN